ncbi:hypothetical protein G6O67_002713 [Ophiocordyceps sinensis]|uniref:Extracellular metalloproteinase n=1 Tax=Ophiocordyceps sinensis TaxID=72228 RepID=A0A8H4PUT0_9HYPO|nr:hypothetical protein G6O67_002713 [Ophiocordyceps sinensis]
MKLPFLGLGLVALAASQRPPDDFAIPKYTSYAQVQASQDVKAISAPWDIAAATKLLQLVVPGAEFRLTDDHHVSSDGVTHVYFRQTWKDTDIELRFFNVNVKNGAIFSYGENFEHSPKGPSKSTRKRAVDDAVTALGTVIRANNLNVTMDDVKTKHLGENKPVVFKGINGTVGDPQAQIVYTVRDGQLTPTWKVEVTTRNSALVSYVNAENTEQVFNTVDCFSNYLATFQVYPWSVPNPDEGSRQIVGDPWDINASPFTWIGEQTGSYHETTRGNNAIAGVDEISNYYTKFNKRSPSYFPVAGPERKFEYPFSTNRTLLDHHVPSSNTYAAVTKDREASITQAFYTVNKYHDLLYLLGFDEKAGNFQANNNGKGGKGNDSVLVAVQDPLSTHRANFYTPEDGKPPVMVLSPTYDYGDRDPAMDATVVIHEYTHGMTSRLTGGPANSLCFALFRGNDFDAVGLSEGWSDFAPLAVHLKPSDNRNMQSTYAPWARARALTGRLRPYSTDMTVNNLTYGMTSQMLDEAFHIYHIGTFWASTLNEVLWNLVDKRGITDKEVPELDARGVPTDGRYYTLKLMMHAMMLQPCFPTPVNARNAILDADMALSDGENQCEIWRAFAKRGLGRLATYEKKTLDTPSQRDEDFSVPDECHGPTGTVPAPNVTSEPTETNHDGPAPNQADDGPAPN